MERISSRKPETNDLTKKGIVINMYTGHVYLYDGTPLKDIKVTDGLNISFTDEDGFYSLAGWERANVISVGALTLYHDDWFRYIDREHSVYDFYISPAPEKDSSRFAHVSDTEIFLDNASVDKWIDFARQSVFTEGCDFLIHTGDICRVRGLEAHYRELNYHTLGIPVRYTIGNHDYVNDKYGEYTFERLYGPVYYSFDFGGTHYVVLPIRKGETAGLYDPLDSVRWLKNDLATVERDKRVVVFSHTYCHESEEDFVYGGEESVDLKEHGILAWIFGHLHINFCNKTECDAFNISTARPDQGGIDLSPASIRIVEIAGGDLTSKIIYNERKYEGDLTPFVYRKKLGAPFFTSPIYSDGRIYAVSADDGFPKSCALYSLDAESGDIIYKIDLGDGVKCEPVYSDGALFVFDTRGSLTAYRAIDGEILWSVTVPYAALNYHKGGLIEDGNLLYVHAGASLCASSKACGELKFTYENNKNGYKSAPILKQDGRIVFPSQWGRLTVLSENGEPLWHNDKIKDAIATPIIENNNLYVPSGTTLYRLDLEAGEVVAKTEKFPDSTFDTPSRPLIINDLIFVATSDSGVIAFEKHALNVKYSYKTSKSLMAICPYLDHSAHIAVGEVTEVYDGVIMFASCDGNVYFYDIDKGEPLAIIGVGTPIITTPKIVKDTLIVTDMHGNLTLYNLPKLKK